MATNVTLMAGASLIFLPSFNADEIIRLLPEATVMMGVPTFYTRLLARKDCTRDLVKHMRLFVSGSAPLSAETHKVGVFVGDLLGVVLGVKANVGGVGRSARQNLHHLAADRIGPTSVSR